MRRIPRPSPAMVVALVGVVIGLGGVAFATIPDSSGTIHGCYGPQGNLRVVESAAGCRTNESSLAWNQKGPPGDGDFKTALVRLSVGETKTILTRPPFEWKADCFASGTFFTSRIQMRSTEEGWTAGGPPKPANQDFAYGQISSHQNEWDAVTARPIVTPSGEVVLAGSLTGVHTYGADCAAAMTVQG